MEKFKSKRLILLFITLASIFALGITTSMAQQRFKIAGKIKYGRSGLKSESINVDDTKGHRLTLNKIEGANASTGVHSFMDGAQVVLTGLVDLVRGNGHHQGYIKMSQNGDSVFFKFKGDIITTISKRSAPEGSTITTYESTYRDTFSIIKGTGQFEGIHGAGSIRGAITRIIKGKDVSRTSSTEWEGEYFIKK